MVTYDQLGFWGELMQVQESTPRHMRCSRTKLKLKGQKVAIVANPKHPLVGQKVWILQNKGETVEAITGNGKQVFVSPELRPIKPGEDIHAEYLTLKHALSIAIGSNSKLIEEIRLIPLS